MKRVAVFVGLFVVSTQLFAASAVWKGDVSAVWDTSALNWTRGGVTNQAYVDGDSVTFDESATSFLVTGATTYAPSSVTLNNTTTYTVSAPIGGSGGLSKNGSGTAVLSGVNIYSGSTTLNGGTLQMSGSAALPAGSKVISKRNTILALVTDASGSVDFGSEFAIQTIDTSTGINSQHTIDVRNSGGGTTGTVINLALLDMTEGDNRAGKQLNVTGDNGYMLQFGDIDLDWDSRGSAAGGPHRLNPTTASLSITGVVKLIDGDTGIRTTDNYLYLGGTASGNMISGTIADADDYPSNTNASPLNVNKGEPSEWTLTGINTYSGTTTIQEGILRINGSLIGTGSVAVTAGALAGMGSVMGSVALSGSGGIDLRDGAVGTLTLGNGLSIDGAVDANDFSFDLGTGGNGTDKLVVTGNVTMATSGAAVITLVQLEGARINAGTYDLIDATGAIPTVGDFTLATTAAFGNTFALQVSGSTLQLVVTAPPPAPLVAYWDGGLDDNWTTAGNWTANADGSGVLSTAPGYETDIRFYATGASRLTSGALDDDFDVNSLSYLASATNNTTIGGPTQTLILEASSGTGVVVNPPLSGATEHTIQANVAMAASQTWDVGSNSLLAVSGEVSDFGSGNTITKTGEGTLSLTGVNTFSGSVVIDGGTVDVPPISGTISSLGIAAPDPSNILLGNGTTLRVSINNDSSDSTDRGFTINGTANGDSATIEAKSVNNTGLKGITFSNGSSPGYGVPDQTRTLILTGDRAPGGGNYNNGAVALNASIADNGSGAVSLIKNGSGYWRIMGSCTYSGGTSINEGYLRVGKNNAFPTDGAVILADVAGAKLVFDGNNQTLGSISGGGSNGGNVELGSGTLTVGDASSTTYSGVISGTGNLTKQGSGTLTLAASNTYSGTTTINAGSLELDADYALGSGDIVMGGGTLALGSSAHAAGSLDVNADSTIILGNGSLSLTNSSAETWSGELTLSGALRSTTLRIGTDANALTPTQLALINNDGASVEISDEGYLVSNKATILIVR